MERCVVTFHNGLFVRCYYKQMLRSHPSSSLATMVPYKNDNPTALSPMIYGRGVMLRLKSIMRKACFKATGI